MARVISGNIGGIRPTVWNNKKLAKIKKTTRDLKADITLYQELGVNWSMVKKHQTLYELLRSEVPTKVSTAHNIHERNSQHQWGGTGIAAFDSVAAKAVDKGADPTEMGRWAWMKWDNGVQPLLMVTAYQPNKSDVTHPSSVYQQQSRQILRTRKEEMDVRHVFREDLCHALRQWRAHGYAIILTIDANKDIRTGPLSRERGPVRMSSLASIVRIIAYPWARHC